VTVSVRLTMLHLPKSHTVDDNFSLGITRITTKTTLTDLKSNTGHNVQTPS